jgi:hypothetical protein
MTPAPFEQPGTRTARLVEFIHRLGDRFIAVELEDFNLVRP